MPAHAAQGILTGKNIPGDPIAAAGMRRWKPTAAGNAQPIL